MTSSFFKTPSHNNPSHHHVHRGPKREHPAKKVSSRTNQQPFLGAVVRKIGTRALFPALRYIPPTLHAIETERQGT